MAKICDIIIIIIIVNIIDLFYSVSCLLVIGVICCRQAFQQMN
jgi:hypothetical protein